MALLQNDKAIFYHPLDDATESLKAQAWTGTSEFIAAKVSTGLKAADGNSPSYGSEHEFQGAGIAGCVETATLSSTKFVVVYQDIPNASRGSAHVGTVSGTDITYGASVEFVSGVLFPAVDAFSETKVVVVYRDTADGNHGTAKVGTVSGTDITFGAETEFASGANGVEHPIVTVLDSSTFVVGYQERADSDKGKAKVGTVSGTDITFGAEAEFSGGLGGQAIDYQNRAAVATLTATKFVVAYRDTTDANRGQAKVGTVSGTGITFGATAKFNSDGNTTFISATALSATKFAVAYRDVAGSNRGRSRIGEVSGTDITYGAEVEFQSTGSVTEVSTAALSSTRFVVMYTLSTSSATSKLGTVSGTDVAFGPAAEFNATRADFGVSGNKLTPTKFIVGFSDTNDDGHGTIKVGDIPSSSSLSGTGASYDSVAAATKVAFAGWLKNPSA